MFTGIVKSEESPQPAELVHLRLWATNAENDNKVEKVVKSRNITEELWKTHYGATFHIDFLAQIKPVCEKPIVFTWHRYLKFWERIYIEQCELGRLGKHLPQAIL